MIFSLFHVLTFTRTGLMTQFLPPGPPATAGGPPTPHPIAKKLQVWTKGIQYNLFRVLQLLILLITANFEPAMKIVAYIELLILARVVIGAVTLQTSIIAPIVFAHFLRQRYYQSSFTRDAIAVADAKIGEFVRREGIPPAVAGVWEKARGLIGRWSGSTLAPQGAAPAAAPRR